MALTMSSPETAQEASHEPSTFLSATTMIVMNDGSKLTPELYKNIREGGPAWIQGVKYFVVDGKGDVDAECYKLKLACENEHLKVMTGTYSSSKKVF
jgi:hypothetical protein